MLAFSVGDLDVVRFDTQLGGWIGRTCVKRMTRVTLDTSVGPTMPYRIVLDPSYDLPF